MKKILISLIIIKLSFYHLFSALFAETVFLKSGKAVNGSAVEETEDYIKVERRGIPFYYLRQDIERIEKPGMQKNKNDPKLQQRSAQGLADAYVQEQQRRLSSQDIKAIIITKPAEGCSPLRVRFNGRHSYSKGARIIYYLWDFGDGDTSTKPSPTNHYLSASYEPRYFTASLTVRDDKGRGATSATVIKITTK